MQAQHSELQVAAYDSHQWECIAGVNLVMLGCSLLQAKLTLYSYPIQIDKKISPLQNDLEDVYEKYR